MTDSAGELLQIANDLEQLAERGEQEDIQSPLRQIKQAVEDVGKAWSNSWVGYQANVYYKDLQPPPPGARFSIELGLQETIFIPGSVGEWFEYDPAKVEEAIYELAGRPDLKLAEEIQVEATNRFIEHRMNFGSILELELKTLNSALLEQLSREASELTVLTDRDLFDVYKPKTVATRDNIALGQGIRLAPHLSVLFTVVKIQSAIRVASDLGGLARQAASHISRQRRLETSTLIRSKVFIGHGHSPIWRELKEFVEERLKLPVDEFNRIPVAGVSNKERLSEMLNEAAIAFLIMTAEDEQVDHGVRARANVIHEAGLFQGSLGFERAIVLLEEGCESFSNIDGLGHIPFPKDNIKAAFEEVRRVMEREGLVV